MFQCTDQVAVHLDPPGRIGVAKPHFGVYDHRKQRGAVGYANGTDDTVVAFGPVLDVAQNQGDGDRAD